MASEFLERQKDDFFRDITSFGSIWFYFIVMLIFLMQENYNIFMELAIGLIFIYFIVVVIRSLHFKERPQKYSYTSFIEKIDAASFPSLHSTRTSFLGIFFISYFNNVFLSMLFVILVFVVAYSRIYLKKHDIKDVSAGVVLGFVVYYAINNIRFIY